MAVRMMRVCIYVNIVIMSCLCMTPTLYHLTLIVTLDDDSHGDSVLTGFCLFVHTISQKPMQL